LQKLDLSLAVRFRFTIIQVFLLATNGVIFKSSDVDSETKFRYGIAMVFICTLIIVFTFFRLVQEYGLKKKNLQQTITNGKESGLVEISTQEQPRNTYTTNQ
jgi:hypothetical protein